MVADDVDAYVVDQGFGQSRIPHSGRNQLE